MFGFLTEFFHSECVPPAECELSTHCSSHIGRYIEVLNRSIVYTVDTRFCFGAFVTVTGTVTAVCADHIVQLSPIANSGVVCAASLFDAAP